jgi:hypothetical protein
MQQVRQSVIARWSRTAGHRGSSPDRFFRERTGGCRGQPPFVNHELANTGLGFESRDSALMVRQSSAQIILNGTDNLDHMVDTLIEPFGPAPEISAERADLTREGFIHVLEGLLNVFEVGPRRWGRVVCHSERRLQDTNRLRKDVARLAPPKFHTEAGESNAPNIARRPPKVWLLKNNPE